MCDNAILLENVHKFYGRLHALRGVQLQVRQGEIFGFLGPNGAGKTTTIRCMLDFIRPDSGTICMMGHDPQREPEQVKRLVGYLPGDLSLEGDLTARGLFEIMRRLRRDNTDWQHVADLAERMDLPLDQKIKTLSQGNRQKAGIVQCLMHRSPLLLLDEPTLGLDPLMKQEVLYLVREARNNGATIFFSSHILSEVQEIADRVGIIRKGMLVEIADTKQLINRSLNRAIVHFQNPVNEGHFTELPSIKILRINDEKRSYTLEVAGDMDVLIKSLANHQVASLEIHRPSLEEIFLKYYQDKGDEV